LLKFDDFQNFTQSQLLLYASRFTKVSSTAESTHISRWCGGTIGTVLDVRSRNRGINSQPCALFGMLFTPMCLCHQAV